MSRRNLPIAVRLDARGIKSLPTPEIHAILRAADPLVAVGGRTLLSKILRGSRSKDVLDHGLALNPAYGFYRGVPEDEVLAKIDWMILHGYLRIVYQSRLPVLAFTREGWEIEREDYANEIVRGFDDMLASSQGPYNMEFLKDRNRTMILIVLDKVRMSGNPKYLPLLDEWARIDHKKVREAIAGVRSHLAQKPESAR